MKTEFPIATGFYEDRSKPVAAQECVNFIPVVAQTNAASQSQLIGTPGITLRSTAGTNAARGAHVLAGVLYVVAGNSLYRENDDGTATSLGTISGTGRVSMADNGTQLCIVVPGGDGYIFTASPDTLTTISDAEYTTNIGPSQQVVFKDGYFIHFNNSSAAGTGVVFFISNLNNGLAYDPLDFGSAEADPDEITGIHVNKNILYVGGEITTEPFQNIGVVAGDFPFQRIPGALVQKGVKAKFSLVDFDNGFAFVGGGENEQPAVYKGPGTPIKLSTTAIDEKLRSLTKDQQSSIYCTTDTVGGGYYLNVHLPDKVYSYDALSSAFMGKPVWFERRSKDEFGRDAIWRVNSISEAYGKQIVTDSQSGNIGELDLNVYQEYGTSINRIVSTQPFSNTGEVFSIGEVELHCESGVGNTVAPGDDPVVRREVSDDGGFTFYPASERKLGKQGERKKRQVWRREGRVSKHRVYRFSMSDPVKSVIIKLEADVL